MGEQPDSSPQGIFDRIWTDLNETYALFEERGIDWNEVYNIYSPRISPEMSDYSLFRVCADMLGALNDPHVGIITPFGQSDFYHFGDMDYEDFIWKSREAFDLGVVQSYMDGDFIIAGDRGFFYGKFKDKPNAGYLFISNFFEYKVNLDIIPDWVKEIDDVIEYLKDTDVLILDLRGSLGGLGSNMDYIASRFASEQKNYIQFCAKNGPGPADFSDPITWSIKPAGNRYTKPIILLTNGDTISASEWFVMALCTQRHVTHVGTPTWGAFSARIIRPLINGWEYSISVLKVTDMNGKCYEGIGISPNEEHIVYNWEEIYYSKDPQLEYALEIF